MFIYLFFIAAIASSSSELPTTELSTTELSAIINEDKELQELITILTTQDPAETTVEIAPQTNDAPVEKVAQPIIITNAIEPSMLAYKHWTGTYTPETFTITINGTEVAQGTQHTLPAETKNIDISFYYSFMNGMRTGTKVVSYQLNENITQATMTFSWKDDHKILLDNATFLKVTA
jgi:hypothetical protein